VLSVLPSFTTRNVPSVHVRAKARNDSAENRFASLKHGTTMMVFNIDPLILTFGLGDSHRHTRIQSAASG
jgi:hypothetical protein